MNTTTLIAAPMDPRRSLGPLAEYGQLNVNGAHDQVDRRFHIQSADSFVVRQSAAALIQERYGWRGYQSVNLPANQTTNRTTLAALEDQTTIGTLTVGLDGPEGMNCEDAFGDKIDALRAARHRICEFTKLAVDPAAGSKRVLAGLFHVAHIVAHRLRGCDTLVIEVNPRHVRYYERMLGLRVAAEERQNRSVNAPAVLMSIDFAYISEQIARYAGRGEGDRSLYSLFFTQREEDGILGRLMAAQTPASMAVN